MSNKSARLGGRLPLLDPSVLTAAQRQLYDLIDTTMVSWASRTGFESKIADGRLIGPFNPALLSPEISEAFLRLQFAESKHTALNERIRQAVILSIGSVWQSPYELYAHGAAARAAGLAEDAIRALAAGQPSAGLRDEERLAQEFALALAVDRKVSDQLYQTCARQFGEKGLVDLIMLAGCYLMICSLLNAFEIPAPISDPLTRKEA